MHSDNQRKDSRLLRMILVLIVLATCLRVWIGPTSIVEPVYAQLPDAAMQRNLLIEEARRTNRLLAEIQQVLREHTLNVRIHGADNPSE